MMKRQFCATLYNEFSLFRNKLKSYVSFLVLMSVVVLFVLVLNVSKITGLSSNNLIIIYSSMYIGFFAFMPLLNFWEERISGEMEYSFSLGLPIRKIIIFKVLSYSIIAVPFVLLTYVLVSCVYFDLNFGYLLFIIITYFMFVIPFGITNGCGMWCLNKTLASILQFFYMILVMIAMIGTIIVSSSTILVENYIIAYIIIDTLMWIISLILLLKANKEKALLNLY